jgi:hypothetical protein
MFMLIPAYSAAQVERLNIMLGVMRPILANPLAVNSALSLP